MIPDGTTIHAIDPGPDCGVVTWHRYEEDEILTYSPRSFVFDTWHIDGTTKRENDEALIHLKKRLQDTVYPADALILEKFEWRKEDAEKRPKIDLRPVEHGAVIELYAHEIGLYDYERFFIQKPSQAVGSNCFWDNWKLRALGLYQPGHEKRHENDALRHLLHWAAAAGLAEPFYARLKQNSKVMRRRTTALSGYHD
jgi:hypothetical protein